MACSVEKNGDIVISGLDKGIGDNPYSGLTDARSVNPLSIPNEASVSFSSATVTGANVYPAATAAADGAGNILVTGLTAGHLLEVGQAIIFSGSTGSKA